MWVFDVMKVACEQFGPYAKVGVPQANNDSGSSPGKFHKNVILSKGFDWKKLYSCHELFN